MPARHHSPNPWLAEQVSLLRAKYTEEDLRSRYRAAVKAQDRLRWSSFLCAQALREAIDRDPSLAMKTMDLNLPETTRKLLLDNELEVLLDLVQLPAESLKVLNGMTEEDYAAITAYLEDMGYPVRSARESVFIHFLTDLHDA